MYRQFSIPPSSIINMHLATFNPLTNNQGHPMTESETLPFTPPEAITQTAKNARPYGPNLEMRLTPPTFHVTYQDDKMISMRVGSDALHPQAQTYDVKSLEEFNNIAGMRLNMLGRLNRMMEKCSLEELQQLKFTPTTRSIYTCALNSDPEVKQMYANTWVPKQLASQTFAASVIRASMEDLGKSVSALTMQCMAKDFVEPYFEALQSGQGSITEKVTRALSYASVKLVMADIHPEDVGDITNFSKAVPAMVEAAWGHRNNEMLTALEDTGLLTMLPEKHSATFKHDYINNANHLLGENTWDGDMITVYRAAESACRAAFHQAMMQGNYDAAGSYVAIQGACVKEINSLKNNNKDNENDVIHHEHDRGYQTYDKKEPEQEMEPKHDDTEDITIDWR